MSSSEIVENSDFETSEASEESSVTPEEKSWKDDYEFPYRKTYDGLWLVRQNNKYGYCDDEGNVIIPLIYLGGSFFSEGLAAVQQADGDHKYGYIDTSGNVVVPFQYDFAAVFRGGIAQVMPEALMFYYDDDPSDLDLVFPYKFYYTFQYIDKEQNVLYYFPLYRRGMGPISYSGTSHGELLLYMPNLTYDLDDFETTTVDVNGLYTVDPLTREFTLVETNHQLKMLLLTIPALKLLEKLKPYIPMKFFLMDIMISIVKVGLFTVRIFRFPGRKARGLKVLVLRMICL